MAFTASIPQVLMTYFAGWSIYNSDALRLHQIAWSKLSHVTYAFGVIDGVTGRVRLTDAWADLGNNNLQAVIDSSSNMKKEPEKDDATGMTTKREPIVLTGQQFIDQHHRGKQLTITSIRRKSSPSIKGQCRVGEARWFDGPVIPEEDYLVTYIPPAHSTEKSASPHKNLCKNKKAMKHTKASEKDEVILRALLSDYAEQQRQVDGGSSSSNEDDEDDEKTSDELDDPKFTNLLEKQTVISGQSCSSSSSDDDSDVSEDDSDGEESVEEICALEDYEERKDVLKPAVFIGKRCQKRIAIKPPISTSCKTTFRNNWRKDKRLGEERHKQPEEKAVILGGNLGSLWTIKQQHRHLKTGLAIGGWTGSGGFAPMVADPVKRRAFIASLMRLCIDAGMDFVAWDWEYPVIGTPGSPSSDEPTHKNKVKHDDSESKKDTKERRDENDPIETKEDKEDTLTNQGGIAESNPTVQDGSGKADDASIPQEAANLILLAKEWHEANAAAVKSSRLKRRLRLHMAIAADRHVLDAFGGKRAWHQLSKYVDLFEVMAYDLCPWPAQGPADHHAPLFTRTPSSSSEALLSVTNGRGQVFTAEKELPFGGYKQVASVDSVLQDMTERYGIAPSKIVMGIPLYGHLRVPSTGLCGPDVPPTGDDSLESMSLISDSIVKQEMGEGQEGAGLNALWTEVEEFNIGKKDKNTNRHPRQPAVENKKHMANTTEAPPPKKLIITGQEDPISKGDPDENKANDKDEQANPPDQKAQTETKDEQEHETETEEKKHAKTETKDEESQAHDEVKEENITKYEDSGKKEEPAVAKIASDTQLPYRSIPDYMRAHGMQSYWEDVCAAEFAVDLANKNNTDDGYRDCGPWGGSQFLSYESPRSIALKAGHLLHHNSAAVLGLKGEEDDPGKHCLAGAFMWEISQDFLPTDIRSLHASLHASIFDGDYEVPSRDHPQENSTEEDDSEGELSDLVYLESSLNSIFYAASRFANVSGVIKARLQQTPHSKQQHISE